MPGHRAQRRRVVLGVLRSEGIEAVQLTDDPFFGSEFFELKRGQFDVQVIRLPDIVHYPTIERFKWRYGIAPERFYPPQPRRASAEIPTDRAAPRGLKVMCPE